ncbi:MAG: phosphatidylglycerol lysyltransferase domain-containing protein [Syntrophorhabdaceae bacterium]|nr:phosphatidylglycerol lysyltransferase domain-containing protein [Syntrophorhabdaceae bacterium]
MSKLPQFPTFKTIGIEDRPFFIDLLHELKPVISEWTFTNLFIWRKLHGFIWSLYKDWLIVLASDVEGHIYAMEPQGPTPKKEVGLYVLQWLFDEKKIKEPSIERAGKDFAAEFSGEKGIEVTPMREHFDYIYLREDLVNLAGNRYRSKRNHINQLIRSYRLEYSELKREHLNDCIQLQERWCFLKRCEDDLNLLSEWGAVSEILEHYEELEVKGGVIEIENKVMAFTIGEMLNEDTAVVHIEKADPQIPGLYQAINLMFCEKAWEGVRFINREQDLGLPGLREAKLSYHPHHFVEKYKISLIPS